MPQWADAVGMLHCDPFQREGETPGGQIAENWGRIFDPVAAADFPALVRWPGPIACHRQRVSVSPAEDQIFIPKIRLVAWRSWRG